MLTTLLSGALLTATASIPAPVQVPAPGSTTDVLAIRIGRAETITQGTLLHAVVLIEDGKITAVGEDLPIERGIPILERPDWVLTPGFVNCHSRLGLDSQAGRDFTPDVAAKDELYMTQDIYGDVLEFGVTTLGLYAPGTGIPGTAVAIRPQGTTAEEAVLIEDAYLKIYMGADANLKKMFRKGWEDLASYEEKEAKAREKWEKAIEKKNKKKDEDKAKDDTPDVFVPPDLDPKLARLIDLREGRIHALLQIGKAADFLHVEDLLEEHDFSWVVRAPLRNDIDLFRVADVMGEAEVTVILDPEVTLQPNTRRERNIPAEMDRAGARVAFVPLTDNLGGHENWMRALAQVVRSGMDRQAAFAAVTLVPAEVLGLGERLGSIDVGKDANLIFWDGDPLEPNTEIKAVMLEGDVVFGDLD